jgi:GT2 family glycosyltransferase
VEHPGTDPTVDIMMPFYGDVPLMQDAVASVIAQDDPHWRLTVVDDRNPDDRHPDDSVAGWFAGLADARVRYVPNEKNLGINRNFQRCVELVEYELAVLMGCDDLLLPGYVTTIRQLFREFPGAGILQPGVEVIDQHGRPVRTLVDEMKRQLFRPRLEGTSLLGGERLATSLLRGNWLYFPSLAWRSDALKRTGFRDGMKVIQDLALVIDLLQQGEQLVVGEVVCFRYRRHLASVSSGQALSGSRFVEERAYFVEVAQRLQAQGWKRAARAAGVHLSSRLHALTLVPTALRTRDAHGLRVLSVHAFGRGGRAPSPAPTDSTAGR